MTNDERAHTIRDQRLRMIDQAINLLRTTGGMGAHTTITGTVRTLTATMVIDAAKELERYIDGTNNAS